MIHKSGIIAQWVIKNRYSQFGTDNGMTDTEMFNLLKNQIENLIKEEFQDFFDDTVEQYYSSELTVSDIMKALQNVIGKYPDFKYSPYKK